MAIKNGDNGVSTATPPITEVTSVGRTPGQMPGQAQSPRAVTYSNGATERVSVPKQTTAQPVQQNALPFKIPSKVDVNYFNGKTYKTKEEMNSAKQKFMQLAYADYLSTGGDDAKFKALTDNKLGLSQIGDHEWNYISKLSNEDTSPTAHTKSAYDQYLYSLGLPSSKDLTQYRAKYVKYVGNGGVADVYKDITADELDYIQKQFAKDYSSALGGNGFIDSKGDVLKYEDTYLDEQLLKLGLPSAKQMEVYHAAYLKDKKIGDDIQDFYKTVHDECNKQDATKESAVNNLRMSDDYKYKTDDDGNKSDRDEIDQEQMVSDLEGKFKTTVQIFEEVLDRTEYKHLRDYYFESQLYPNKDDKNSSGKLKYYSTDEMGRETFDSAKFDADYLEASEKDTKRMQATLRISLADFDEYHSLQTIRDTQEAHDNKRSELRDKALAWFGKGATTDAEKKQREIDLSAFVRFGSPSDSDVKKAVEALAAADWYFTALDAGAPVYVVTKGIDAVTEWNNKNTDDVNKWADVQMANYGFTEDQFLYNDTREALKRTRIESTSYDFERRSVYDTSLYNQQLRSDNTVTVFGAAYAEVNGLDHTNIQTANADDDNISKFNYLFRDNLTEQGKPLIAYLNDTERGVFNSFFSKSPQGALNYLMTLSDMLADRAWNEEVVSYNTNIEANMPDEDYYGYMYDAYLYADNDKNNKYIEGTEQGWKKDAWRNYKQYSDDDLDVMIAELEQDYSNRVGGENSALSQENADYAYEVDLAIKSMEYVKQERADARALAQSAVNLRNYKEEDGAAATKEVRNNIEKYEAQSENARFVNQIDSGDTIADRLRIANEAGIKTPTVEALVQNPLDTKMWKESELTSFYSEMTSEQVDEYNWLLVNNGANAADAFLDTLKSGLDAKGAKKAQAEGYEFGTGNGVMATIASVIGYPVSGMMSLMGTGMNAASGIETTRTQASQWDFTGIWREAVASEIDSPALSFLYTAAMSTCDSTVAMALDAMVPFLGESFMAASAYASSLRQGLDEGLDANQAITSALFSAGIEFVTEHIGLDAIGENIKAIGKSSKPWLQFVKSVIGSSASEGSEEVASHILNAVSDYFLNGDKNALQRRHDALMEQQGLTGEEAWSLTWKEWRQDGWEQFAAGAFSGGLMTTVGGGIKAGKTAAKLGAVKGLQKLNEYAYGKPADTLKESKPPAKVMTDEQVKQFNQGKSWLGSVIPKQAVSAISDRVNNNKVGSEKVEAIRSALVDILSTGADTQIGATGMQLFEQVTDKNGNTQSVPNEDRLTALASAFAVMDCAPNADSIDAAFVRLQTANMSVDTKYKNKMKGDIKTPGALRNLYEAISKFQQKMKDDQAAFDNWSKPILTDLNSRAQRINALQKSAAAETDVSKKAAILKEASTLQEQYNKDKANYDKNLKDQKRKLRDRNKDSATQIKVAQEQINKHFSALASFLATYAPKSYDNGKARTEQLNYREKLLGTQLEQYKKSQTLSEKDKKAQITRITNQMVETRQQFDRLQQALIEEGDTLSRALAAVREGTVEDFIQQENERYQKNAESSQQNAEPQQNASEATESAKTNQTGEDTSNPVSEKNKAQEKAREGLVESDPVDIEISKKDQNSLSRSFARIGLELVWESRDKIGNGKANGYYDSGNKIHLATTMRTTKGELPSRMIAQSVVVHEIVHYVAGTESYVDLKNAALEYLSDRYGDQWVDNLLNGIAEQRYEDYGQVLSEAGVQEEMTALFVEDCLFNGQSGDDHALTRLTRKSAGLVSDILHHIQDLITRGNIRKQSKNDPAKLALLDAEMKLGSAIRERQYLDKAGKKSAFESVSDRTEKQAEPSAQTDAVAEESAPVAEEAPVEETVETPAETEAVEETPVQESVQENIQEETSTPVEETSTPVEETAAEPVQETVAEEQAVEEPTRILGADDVYSMFTNIQDREQVSHSRGNAPVTTDLASREKAFSGVSTRLDSTYRNLGYPTVFSGMKDGDVYFFGKEELGNTAGRQINYPQNNVTKARNLSRGNSFIDNVINFPWMTISDADSVGIDNQGDDAVFNRERNTAGSDIQFSTEDKAKLSKVAGLLSRGKQVEIRIPADSRNGKAYTETSLQVLREVFSAIPANKRTSVSFATGVTSNEITRNPRLANVDLILTTTNDSIGDRRSFDITPVSDTAQDVRYSSGKSLTDYANAYKPKNSDATGAYYSTGRFKGKEDSKNNGMYAKNVFDYVADALGIETDVFNPFGYYDSMESDSSVRKLIFDLRRQANSTWRRAKTSGDGKFDKKTTESYKNLARLLYAMSDISSSLFDPVKDSYKYFRFDQNAYREKYLDAVKRMDDARNLLSVLGDTNISARERTLARGLWDKVARQYASTYNLIKSGFLGVLNDNLGKDTFIGFDRDGRVVTPNDVQLREPVRATPREYTPTFYDETADVEKQRRDAEDVRRRLSESDAAERAQASQDMLDSMFGGNASTATVFNDEAPRGRDFNAPDVIVPTWAKEGYDGLTSYEREQRDTRMEDEHNARMDEARYSNDSDIRKMPGYKETVGRYSNTIYQQMADESRAKIDEHSGRSYSSGMSLQDYANAIRNNDTSSFDALDSMTDELKADMSETLSNMKTGGDLFDRAVEYGKASDGFVSERGELGRGVSDIPFLLGREEQSGAVSDGSAQGESPLRDALLDSLFSESDRQLEERFRQDEDIRYASGLTMGDLVRRHGRQKQNDFAKANNIEVAKWRSRDRKISQSVQRMASAEYILQSTRDFIMQSTISAEFNKDNNRLLGVFSPKSLEDIEAHAANSIARAGGLTQALENTTKQIDAINASNVDTILAKAGILLREIGAEGADGFDKNMQNQFFDFLSSYAIACCNWGRQGNIMKLVNKLPQGRKMYWEKVVARMNEKNAKAVSKGANRLVYRNVLEDIVIPPQLYDALTAARNQTEINQAEYAITQYIGEHSPLTVSGALRNWRYFSMLANPVTHARNMLGNTGMLGGRMVKDVIASGLESAAVKAGWMKENERTHAIALSEESLALAQELWDENREFVQIGGHEGFNQQVREAVKKSPFGFVDKLMRVNSNALESEDKLFLYATFMSAARQYITAQGIDPKNMSKAQRNSIIEYATQQAQEATYRDSVQIADILHQISQMGAFAEFAVDSIMPFKKTPINIARRGIEYSPVGLGVGLYHLVNDAIQVKRGGKLTTSAAKVCDELAKGLTGSALALIGFFLSKAGILKIHAGDGDRDEQYEKDVGHQDYSIEIGDLSIKIEQLAPLTFPLFMGASYEKLSKMDLDAFSLADFGEAMLTIADPIMDMSFLSGMNSTLETYGSNGLGGVFGNMVASYTGQFLPTIGSKINNATPFIGDTRLTSKSSAAASNTKLDYQLRAWASKIPGLNKAVLEPYVSTTGGFQKKDSWQDWVLAHLNNFALPTNVQIIDSTPVNQEIARLYSVTGTTDFIPKNPKKSMRVNGEDYKMTAKEYTEFSKEHNDTVYAAISNVINSVDYRRSSDDHKAEMLEYAYDTAHKAVSEKYKAIFARKKPQK